MAEIETRIEGRIGRITLNRPQALNALDAPMCRALDDALVAWSGDPAVALVVIDAAGERAFCAGGDIASVYREGIAGATAGARAFWREEYVMNARLAEYPKPVVSLMQGYVMGGGVGIGCHGHPRVVGETTKMAMPECAIGLIPDVGGTYLLGRAPGLAGDYLGLTGTRMGPGDAIYAGFADRFVPEADWPALIAALAETGSIAPLDSFAAPPPEGTLPARQAEIDTLFAGADLAAILAALRGAGTDFAAATLGLIEAGSPLSAACTLAMVRAQRAAPDLRRALQAEYRYTHRAVERSDLLEGIRAAVIDKDRSPRWQITGAAAEARAEEMRAPLGDEELSFGED